MQRCDGMTMPDYYTGPTRRPQVRCTGMITPDEFVWDSIETWITTAEWLAWIRRRDGVKCYYGRHGWCYPVRPIISAHRLPWYTLKFRRLP